MAEFKFPTDLASRVSAAPAPIKRTVERAEKPNPLLPFLDQSWSERTKRDGSDVETGSTQVYRSYSPAETLAVVRALRRGSDKRGIGVRIVPPQTIVPVTDEDGNPVYVMSKGSPKLDKEGKPIQRTRVEYRAGQILFETHTRQERKRTEAEQAEQDGQDGTEDTDQGDAEDAEDTDQDDAEDTDQDSEEDGTEDSQDQNQEDGWQ